jgi:Flp pilus assembly protein TadD
MTETLPSTVDSESTDVQELALPYHAIRGRLRIRAHATRLFNDGLAAARNGRPDLARDFFAAFVFWYPHDPDARSALALACLESGDRGTAREHWQQVLDQHPNDQKALRGLHALATLAQQPTPADSA